MCEKVRRVKCTILSPGGLYVRGSRHGSMSRWCTFVGLAEQIMYFVFRAGDLSDSAVLYSPAGEGRQRDHVLSTDVPQTHTVANCFHWQFNMTVAFPKCTMSYMRRGHHQEAKPKQPEVGHSCQVTVTFGNDARGRLLLVSGVSESNLPTSLLSHRPMQLGKVGHYQAYGLYRTYSLVTSTLTTGAKKYVVR